jgi:hypothetical protein
VLIYDPNSYWLIEGQVSLRSRDCQNIVKIVASQHPWVFFFVLERSFTLNQCLYVFNLFFVIVFY